MTGIQMEQPPVEEPARTEPDTEPPLTGGPAAPRKPRRVLRAVARWTCAVLAFAAAAAGTAYAVTEKERTDLPGLATESDGRWEYPALKLPALPKGTPGPFAASNLARIHHADLRTLLVPAPRGAKTDKELPGRGGWLPLTSFAAAFQEDRRKDIVEQLREVGLKHIAATGWTMPDGTRTRIYLLRFGNDTTVNELTTGVFQSQSSMLIEQGDAVTDDVYDGDSSPEPVLATVLDEEEPAKVHVRQAYLQAGDVLAMVVQDRAGAAPAVPFHQTVILQSQLLT
ncbi:hypothetical protein AB0M28_19215 [Streptomyces sp. NPDC051940]|uniref:hypothetical protein n=1 Tax=Streptomyces sp. NPDC051940 TaxID=3155675 RepID=UPI003417C4B0